MAEAANPEWTSVPLVGWNMACAIARRCDAHILTHIRNRAAILRAGLTEGRDFTAIDNEAVAAPMYRFADRVRGGDGKGWTTMMAFSSIAYYSFEREVWRRFGQRISEGEFDLVHRITPLSPANQSLIAKRLAKVDVPFVIGPLNGGVPWPKHFSDRRHAEKEWLSYVRGAYRFMPHYTSTRSCAAAILVASRHTLREMPEWAHNKCTLLPENGIDESEVTPRTPRAPGGPLQAVFVGRLVPLKGVDMLINSVAPFLEGGSLSLSIIGDGPQQAELEQTAEELGVRDRILFHGWLSHAETLQHLSTADLMILPSIKEFGGGVVIEGMAKGAIPIVADYAGPAELVDDATGFRVPFTDKQSLIEGLRRVVGELISDPSKLQPMIGAAQKKVLRDLTWQAKAERILQVYDRVLTARSIRDSAQL